MGFYAPEIVIFDIMPPLSFNGEAANQRNWVAFFDQFDGDPKVTFADEYIECSEDLAFVREFTRLEGQVKGKPYDVWTRETNCLRRGGDRWLIIHAHTSIPIDFENMTPCTHLSPE